MEKAANKFAMDLLIDEKELEECGSFEALFQKYEMSDEDIKDISSRFNRLWNVENEKIEDQIRYVVSQMKGM